MRSDDLNEKEDPNGVAEGAFRRRYGRFRRRPRDPGRSEELTRNAFADAAASLPDEQPGDPPVLAWLYTVARRRFADEARRRGRERRAVDLLSRRSASGYEPIAGALREAIGTLPTGQATVVRLKLVSRLTFAEIGAEVGLTETAARMRFVGALERLRAELGERGIEA